MSNREINIPGLDIPAFLKAVESPYDTQNIFDLIRTIVHSENAPALTECLRAATERDAGLQRLFSERFVPPMPSNEELLAFPANSLGRTLVEHLIRNDIKLDFQGINTHVYANNETFDEYVRQRALRVHDILHVVVGADTSPIGEGQLSAFLWAQYASTFHAAAISYKTLHVAFHDSKRLHEWIRMLSEALNAGQKATPVFGIPWELHWVTDVENLRDRFQITKLSAPGPALRP